jgi:hypothetical protein
MIPTAWLTVRMTLGELAVAVGTGLLALLTGWLGLETRASAKAAQEAVEESEEPFVIATPTDDLEAMQLRPYELTPGELPPVAIHRAADDDTSYFVRLKLWNIGAGPAIVRAVMLDDERGAEYLDHIAPFYPIPARGAADVEIRSSAWPDASPASARLTIQYYRANGTTYLTESDVVIEGSVVTAYTYRRRRPELRH